jgi:hypothetical protein
MAGEHNTDNIERMIRLVEITLTLGRHVLHIVWIIFIITIASAIYDFATANIFWGIIASAFAVADAIFIAQIYERRSRHRQRRRHAKVSKAKPEYKEVTSA